MYKCVCDPTWAVGWGGGGGGIVKVLHVGTLMVYLGL